MMKLALRKNISVFLRGVIFSLHTLLIGTIGFSLAIAFSGCSSKNSEVDSSYDSGLSPSPSPSSPQSFTISSATAGNQQVALSWNASTGATSYTVKYGTSSGNYSSTFATGVAGTSSTVTGLTNGTTYYFMITAVNTNGSTDADSEFVRTPAQPTLTDFNDQTTLTFTAGWSNDYTFTLGGLASLTCNGTVAATSSNTSVVSNASLTLSGTYPNCNLNVAVSSGITGTTTITVTATYGSATAVKTFTYTILPQAVAAFSTRKAVFGYTGNALRVRNSANNAEADVSFDSSGWVSATSTATITSVGSSSWTLNETMNFSDFYVDSSNSLVKTWYDQSGSGNNATQATASKQPKIVSAGVLSLSSGQPAVLADGASQRMDVPAVTADVLTAVATPSTNNGGGGYRGITASNTAQMLSAVNGTFNGYGEWGTWGGGDKKSGVQLVQDNTYVLVMSGGTFYTNGATNNTYSATSGQTGQLFGSPNGSQCFAGSISEVIWYSSALGTTDRQALQNIQYSSFGVSGI